MTEPSTPSRRVLSRDVRTEPLHHGPVEGVVSGSPTTGSRVLDTVSGAEVGIWEITTGTVRDTEVDEVFVVLAGRARVDFEDGESLDLSPGAAVRLGAGERTTWTITETLRKIWVA